MSTIYINNTNCGYRNGLAVYESDSSSFPKILDNEPLGLEWLYVAPEACEVKYQQSGAVVSKKADKGDIILVFRHEDKNPVAIVKNNEWKENFVYRKAKKESERAFDSVICGAECCPRSRG